MKPETHYANHAVVGETDTEVVVDFHFRTGERGRHSQQCRVVLPPAVAARLGLLLSEGAKPVEGPQDAPAGRTGDAGGQNGD